MGKWSWRQRVGLYIVVALCGTAMWKQYRSDALVRERHRGITVEGFVGPLLPPPIVTEPPDWLSGSSPITDSVRLDTITIQSISAGSLEISRGVINNVWQPFRYRVSYATTW